MRSRSRQPNATAAVVRQARRVLGDGLFAGAIAAVAFLLLCWPFVRTPPPDAAAALAYLFGIWAAFIAVLVAMMAASRGSASRREKTK